MISNPNDSALEKRVEALEELLRANPFESASVRNGRLRFIGGTLRLDSGAMLDLIGQWRFSGPGAITGDVFSEGKWTQVGDWDFTGNGDLAGDVTLSGNFDLTGKFTSEGIRIEDGKIHVGTGASEIVIDGATGAITTGNVKIQNGKITVGTGAAQIVIDGATGKIVAGNLAIDPADGGTVTFPGGAVVRASSAGGIEMRQGSYSAVVSATGASIGKSGLAVAVTDAAGVQFVGVPTGSPGPSIPANVYYRNSSGQVRVASGS